MKEAHNSALNSFFKYLQTEEDFVPEKYSILISSKDEVIGLSTLLESWRSYVLGISLDVLNRNKATVEQWIKSLEFDNPGEFITSSQTSGTALLRNLYNNQLIQLIKQEVKTYDFDYLDKAATFYNASIKVKEQHNSVNLLDEVNADDFDNWAVDLAEKYFEIFAQCEEAYRTTPNPYADSIVSQVFGLI